MSAQDTGARSARNADRRDAGGGKKWIWALLALLVIAAILIIGFFALGGDVDGDTEGQLDVNVETPESDVDVDAPDIDAEAPDVDVDPGSLDVEEGDAEADAGND